MNLVDENNKPLNAEKKIVDASGEEVSSAAPTPMATADIGLQLCNHMLTKAMELPQNELVNKQFDVLYHAALNILAHRIVNVGLGMEVGNLIAEWDASRAFASEKNVQEDLSTAVTHWKQQFTNGELYFHPGKPT